MSDHTITVHCHSRLLIVCIIEKCTRKIFRIQHFLLTGRVLHFRKNPIKMIVEIALVIIQINCECT